MKWFQLHKACYNGYRDVAKVLLQKDATVDVQTNSGWTPLHVAAKFSKVRAQAAGIRPLLFLYAVSFKYSNFGCVYCKIMYACILKCSPLKCILKNHNLKI